MKIGVISDSHKKVGYTQEVIAFLKEKQASYLFHAGDLCVEDNLKLLQDSKLPYVTVFGNNDSKLSNLASKYVIKNEPYHFKIKDIKFKLMHLPYYLNGNSDIVIFGHTHKFECSFINGTLFLNPGEVCARNKPVIECALLEIKENEYIINYYYKNINDKNFTKEEFRYERQ